MKLAFSGQARYTDFETGYQLYRNRAKNECSDLVMYKRAIRAYCKRLAARLKTTGIIDLPAGLGSLAAVTMIRKPQYRGKKFIGFGKMDWEKGYYDGDIHAFGIVFLPKRTKSENLRSYGFVANRRLFKEVKNNCMEKQMWSPLEFSDEMI